jgi:hypothetical protein
MYFRSTINPYTRVGFGKKTISFGSLNQVSDFVRRYLIEAPKEFTKNMLDNAKDFFDKNMGNQTKYRHNNIESIYKFSNNITPIKGSDKLQTFKYPGYPYVSSSKRIYNR